jgi:IS5 family transposase
MCIRHGQARALLEPHGEADTAAAAKLITGVMKRFAADKGTGRAGSRENLRDRYRRNSIASP